MSTDLVTSLADRRVVVTGGSRGLGRVMALALARAGARVGIVASTDSAALRETMVQAEALLLQHPVEVVTGDLRDPAACARMAGELSEALGRVDVLVNNAGVPNVGAGLPFWRVPPSEWQHMTHTNVDGVFLLTREFVPAMISRGFGRIVNISTGEATMVRKHFAPYGPTKAFVEAASRIFAQDLAETGVTVNVLLPGGAVDTVADVTGRPTPGRTFLPSSVMGPPLLWLASDLSGGHTGQRFVAKSWDESKPLGERIADSRQASVDVPCIM